jgi:hypothetical protein
MDDPFSSDPFFSTPFHTNVVEQAQQVTHETTPLVDFSLIDEQPKASNQEEFHLHTEGEPAQTVMQQTEDKEKVSSENDNTIETQPQEEDPLEKLKQEATCIVCNQIYREPRVLNCLHSFCTPCLSNLMSNKQISCPTCNYVTFLNSGVQELFANPFLNHKLQTIALSTMSAPKCESCDDDAPEDATGQCTECPKFLCDFHIQSHKKTKETKGHRIISMDGMLPDDTSV